MERAFLNSLLALANALEARDAYTRGHSDRVAATARGLALASGLTSPAAETVAQAGRLHDLGKIGVPESVLGKCGPLTDEEWAVMRLHPLTGAQILAPLEFFGDGMLIVRHHHERFDGSGYPDGLRGAAIPLGARIVAVADVYDALTSDRAYRRRLSHPLALERLRGEAGRPAAFLLGHLLPWGSLAFLLIPPLLVHECRGHPTLRRIGFLSPVRPACLLVGLGVGAFLGGHLLVTSSLTFGYAISVVSVAAYTSAVAYHVGANSLSAEGVFPGALFSHWWRHWGFWGAVPVSTAFTLVRYLLDPALPQAPEARAGAIVYLAALALGAAALRAWSGSLVP